MIPLFISDWHSLSLALGWTLIHSLWQAGVVAGLLYIVLGWIKTPRERYLTLLTGFLMVPLIAGFTFWMHYSPAAAPDYISVEQYSIVLESDNATEKYSAKSEYQQKFLPDQVEGVLPVIAVLWAIGFFILLTRWVSGLWYLRQLKKWSTAIENEVWNRVRTKVEQKVAVTTIWDLRCSPHVAGPVLIGWIKPVVLIPIGMVNGLTEEEVEAVLAHELAHLSRRDFPVNLIQTFIETFFYFNPGILIMSKWISNEREHCCDDLAVKTIQNPLIYAKTLIKADALSERDFFPLFAQSLKGNNNSLLLRVERILFQKHKKNKIMVRSITAFCTLMFTVVFILAAGLPDMNSSKELLSNDQTYMVEQTEGDHFLLSELADPLSSLVEGEQEGKAINPQQTNSADFLLQQAAAENEGQIKQEILLVFEEVQRELSSLYEEYKTSEKYSDSSEISPSAERGQTSSRVSEKVESIIEEVRKGLEEIDWNEVKEEVKLALSEAQIAMENLKYKLSKIKVDTLIIVDPSTFRQVRYLRTTISELKLQNGTDSKMDFSIVASMDQKEQIKDLAIAFRNELMSKGLIESGSCQVLLNQNELKINGQEKSTSDHRKLLKKYQDQIEGFYEIWLNVRK